jgi:TolA-binding protein
MDQEVEQNWQRKAHESKKRGGGDEDGIAADDAAQKSDVNEAECDMNYLLKRGKAFFESGDYDSAVEVYSHGILMYPKYGK